MRGRLIRGDGELFVVIPENVAAQENLQEGTEVEVTLVPTFEELDPGPSIGNK